MKNSWAIWPLLFVLIPLRAQNIEYTEFTLDNGLHVILHQDNATPIVAVSLFYHVGSKNENPERTGFAHFFEHLLFEGSKHMKRGDFDKLLLNAGATNNATTDQDRTFYYEVLPSNQLELGLWMEAERMLHANILQEGVDTQREVVKEERRMRVDNRPYGSFMEQIFKHAYSQHPYRWSVIGSLEHLNQASLEEFMAFYKEFYVPDNAILSIAGDLDVGQTKQLVNKYFGDIPRGEKPIKRPEIVEPEQTAEIRDVIYDNVQLPGVMMSYRIPPQGTPDFYALDMLMTLLSQGESSRLNKEIKDRQQKALFTGAFPLPMEDAGQSIIFSLVSMGVTPEELEAALEAEIDKVKQELISEKELQKLRNQKENEFVNQNATVFGVAGNLARYHAYFGDTSLINKELDRYLKVTREDLQRVARKYLVKKNRVVLYYLPKAEQKKEKNG